MNHLQLASGRLFKSPAPATGGRERRRMAMTEVTNVLCAGMMTPPNIVRRASTSDDFEDIIYAPTKFHYQDCSPPWSHHVEQQQQQQSSSHERRSSHRRVHAMDWNGITSTTQASPSHDEDNGATRSTPTRKFEQLRNNTLCSQRRSRSSELHLSSQPTLHTQRYQSVSSSTSKELHSDLHHCNQNNQDNITNPSCVIPSNISELISDLTAKAKLFSREEEEEYDDSSSLDYSSDDSMIEAAIYKSAAPPPPIKQQHSTEKNDDTGGVTMNDLICAVCLDFPDDPKHIATVSGCTHRFCFGCIDKWAKKGNNECPLCKSIFHLVASGDRVRWY